MTTQESERRLMAESLRKGRLRELKELCSDSRNRALIMILLDDHERAIREDERLRLTAEAGADEGCAATAGSPAEEMPVASVPASVPASVTASTSASASASAAPAAAPLSTTPRLQFRAPVKNGR